MKDVADPMRKEQGFHAAPQAGVSGWLLVLCLMLTVVGPLISAWIVTTEFNALAAVFVVSRGAQWAMILSIVLTTCSIAFGIYAGLRLWTVKPRAVHIARAALLFGLGVDVVTTTIATVVGTVSSAEADVFYDVLMNLIPSLLFFTLCLAYLNNSTRVNATYPED